MENNNNTQQIPTQNQPPVGGQNPNGYNQPYGQFNQPYGQQPQFNGRFSQPYPAQKEKGNNTVIIALVAVLIVLLISLVAIIAVITVNSNKEQAKAGEIIVDVRGGETKSNPRENGVLVTDSYDTSIFVRSGPGKQYTKVMEIDPGDTDVKLMYTGTSTRGKDGYIWYEVVTPFGTDAWVRSDIVVFE